MNIQDIIIESYVIRTGGYTVVVAPHVDEQRQRRHVSRDWIALILTRLNRVKHLIKRIPAGQRFVAFDPETDTGIGLVRSTQDENKLFFNTVFRGVWPEGSMPRISVR